MRLFSNLFSSKPLQFSRNETFCEPKGLLKVFGAMRLTGNLHQIFFSKNSETNSSIFLFFERFSVEKDVFLVFPVGENDFRVLCVSRRVFFGAVKLMKY